MNTEVKVLHILYDPIDEEEIRCLCGNQPVSIRDLFQGTDTHSIVIQRGVMAAVTLDVFTCTNKRPHASSAYQSLFQGLEPVPVGAAMFVVVIAQR